MSKTNFTKVEEALAEGLRKIELEKLRQEAKARKQQAESPATPPSPELDAEHRRKKHALKLTLKWLLKQDKGIYSKLKTSEKEVKRLLEGPGELSEFDWEVLEMILTRADTIKKEMKKKAGALEDEELVEEQRTKHLTKRFNVNDKWLPLK